MYLFEIAQTELQAVLRTWAHWGMTKLQNNVFHFVASSFPICPKQCVSYQVTLLLEGPTGRALQTPSGGRMWITGHDLSV